MWIIKLFKNKKNIIIIILLIIFLGVVKYYQFKVSSLQNDINKCSIEKDKLNVEIYNLKVYSQELENLINEQNRKIEHLNNIVANQRSMIAKYSIDYDNIKKEKQKLIEQYFISPGESLKEINMKANQLIEEILWKD